MSIIVTVAVCLGLLLVPSMVSAQPFDCGIEIDPALTKVGCGDTFDVNVVVKNPTTRALDMIMCNVSFTPGLLEVTSVDYGATVGSPFTTTMAAPSWSNVTGELDYDGGCPPGTNTTLASIVYATIHMKCNCTASATGTIQFRAAGPWGLETTVIGGGTDYLNWATQVVNGTVKCGKAVLSISTGMDLVFDRTTANYSCIVPGMYANNVSDYRMPLGAGAARVEFCPWANRLALGGAVPVMVQAMDVQTDATGDFVSRTIYLMAFLGGPPAQESLVQNFVYPGGLASHGAPYWVGKNWTYNSNMYLPALATWVNGTYWANVTAYEMVALNAGCGAPPAVPAYKIVRTNLAGAGNVSGIDWFADPAVVGPLGFVKQIENELFLTPDTAVLSGITGPNGTIEIKTAPNAGNPGAASTEWTWDTLVTLEAHADAGWTFSHWMGDLACGPNPGVVNMSEDRTVVAMFCELPPALSYLGPADLFFTCRTGGLNPDDQILEIMNSGGGTLAWTVTDDAAWLSEAPTSGGLAAGVHQDINVSVDNSGLIAGTYNANVTISGSTVVVPVELLVTPATSIDVMRNLPGNAMDLNETYPGDTFDVYVNFTAPVDDFNGIGLTDLAPDGWAVEVNTAWCDPVADEVTHWGNKVEVAWYGPYTMDQNFSVRYEVTVPETATPGINEFPNCAIDEAWAEYYFGESDAFASCVQDEFQIMITVPGDIVGETRDVNAHLLPDTLVTLKRSAAWVADDESTPNYSITCWNTGNDYWLRGTKDRYFILDTNVVGGIAGHNIAHPQYMDFSTAALLVGGYTLDLEGDYGLVPRACTMSYAMKSVNLWQFWPAANNEWGLSIWKAMESVNSWQNPS